MTDSARSIFVALDLPQPWPPSNSTILIKQRHDLGELQVDATSNGGFVVYAKWNTDQDIIFSEVFQQISLINGPRVVLFTEANKAAIKLRINSITIRKEVEATESLTISGGKQASPRFRRFSEDLISSNHSPVEKIFLGKVIELDQKLQQGDWYSLVSASGLIRALLVDQNPLVHIVNRAHRLSLVFRGHGRAFRPPKISVEYSAWISGIPENGAPLVSLDDFLGSPCLFDNGQVKATVIDIIKLLANTQGGIHFDKVRDPAHAALKDNSELITNPTIDLNAQALKSIGDAILDGLKPLVDAISSQTKPQNQFIISLSELPSPADVSSNWVDATHTNEAAADKPSGLFISLAIQLLPGSENSHVFEIRSRKNCSQLSLSIENGEPFLSLTNKKALFRLSIDDLLTEG